MTHTTPTPWQIKNDHEPALIIANVDGETFADGSSSHHYDFVANLDWDEYGDVMGDRETKIANAAFIVKAVNSHDHLIKVLKFSRSMHEETTESYEPDTTEAGLARMAIDRIDDALKLAGEA